MHFSGKESRHGRMASDKVQGWVKQWGGKNSCLQRILTGMNSREISKSREMLHLVSESVEQLCM